MGTHYASHSSVEACLAQAWTFLTGETLPFFEAPCTTRYPNPGWSHFMVTFHPPEVSWCAGVILSLTSDPAGRTDNNGSEICNVFSGCVAQIFDKREDFVVGLPISIDAAQLSAIAQAATFSRCYASADTQAKVLAFEADHGMPATPFADAGSMES